MGVDELEELMRTGSVRTIDVREAWEYRRGHVAGTVPLPVSRLGLEYRSIPRDLPIAVICEHGNRSLMVADFLIGQGYDATSVRGGTTAWARSGRPLEGGSAHVG